MATNKTFDLVSATRDEQTGQFSEWQSITDGQGGWPGGEDLRASLKSYLCDCGQHEDADRIIMDDELATIRDDEGKVWYYDWREQA